MWVAAASVYDNMRTKRTNETILSTVQAVRSLYASANNTGYSAVNPMTTDLIAAGVIPQDMLSGSVTVNPWSSTAGSFKVLNATTSVPGDSFQLVFDGLPQKACVSLLVSNSQNAQGTGLSNYGIAQSGSTTASTAVPTTGIPPNTAATGCGTAGTNSVALMYKLKT